MLNGFNSCGQEVGSVAMSAAHPTRVFTPMRPSANGEASAKFPGFFRMMSRGLLDRFLDKSASEAGKGVYLTDDQRRYLDFPAIKAHVGDDAASLVDELISKQSCTAASFFVAHSVEIPHGSLLAKLPRSLGASDAAVVRFTANRTGRCQMSRPGSTN